MSFVRFLNEATVTIANITDLSNLVPGIKVINRTHGKVISSNMPFMKAIDTKLKEYGYTRSVDGESTMFTKPGVPCVSYWYEDDARMDLVVAVTKF